MRENQAGKASRLLFAAILSMAFIGTASAAPHGILWTPARRADFVSFDPLSAGPGKLVYYGGPVISHAKVYAVFWGEGVAPEIQSRIGAFYSNILNSGYMDWLSEYGTNITAINGRPGTNQTIGRGSFAGSVMITPKNSSLSLTDGMVQREIEAQIAAGMLAAPSADTLYMVYFPPGVTISIDSTQSCSDFCAYHEGFKSKNGASIYYGIMPDCGSMCGVGGSAFDGITATSSHETIEAVTDPFPTPGTNPAYPQAWNTTTGDEIADICEDNPPAYVSGNGGTSAVAQLWDNSANVCAAGPWSAFGSAKPAAIAAAVSPAIFRPLPVLRGILPAAGLPLWDGR
ncbi:MAG: hypothetical protein ACYCPQ_09225 [Elusimicrobiota bacterium]